MLINLVPDFLAVLADADREAAWHQYFESHSAILTAYWRNYVLEPGSPAAAEVVRNALAADRSDLHALLAGVDVVRVVEDTLARAEDVLQIDRPTDCYLMVGMGGANAGELVVGGRGVAFICLEHFTARANPQTYGLGLTPDLLPLWVAHEMAHTVRYTSPDQPERSPSPGRGLGGLLRLLGNGAAGHAAGAAGQRGAGGAGRGGRGARVPAQ